MADGQTDRQAGRQGLTFTPIVPRMVMITSLTFSLVPGSKRVVRNTKNGGSWTCRHKEQYQNTHTHTPMHPYTNVPYIQSHSYVTHCSSGFPSEHITSLSPCYRGYLSRLEKQSPSLQLSHGLPLPPPCQAAAATPEDVHQQSATPTPRQ